eukprot:scaffold1886_cov38-Phaeocystis_antarctica.AAC.1
MAWPARALRCDWRAELRGGIASETNTRLAAYDLLNVDRVGISGPTGDLGTAMAWLRPVALLQSSPPFGEIGVGQEARAPCSDGSCAQMQSRPGVTNPKVTTPGRDG